MTNFGFHFGCLDRQRKKHFSACSLRKRESRITLITFHIAKSVIDALPYNYADEVERFRQAKLAHRFTGDAAPSAPALIESAVRRVQTEGQADDFVADYAIIDDVPVPTLDECKRALVTKVRIMEETAMASIISPARERLMGIDVNAIYAKPETERSDADRALLAKAADIAARRAALQRHSANLEVAVEELTESAIDGWMPAPFPS